MAKSKTINFNEFMSGAYRTKEKEKKQRNIKKVKRIAGASILPIMTGGAVGMLGLTMTAFAATNSVTVMAPAVVDVSAKAWMSQQTLSTLAHILDPLVDIMVALSFPIASVIIVGSCFFFMFNQSEKGWDTIMKAGLGYVLIQVSPLILDVLKQVGNAV